MDNRNNMSLLWESPVFNSSFEDLPQQISLKVKGYLIVTW